MTPRELAEALGPIVTAGGRQALGRMARGETPGVYLQYTEVRDYEALGRLAAREDVKMWDGYAGLIMEAFDE